MEPGGEIPDEISVHGSYVLSRGGVHAIQKTARCQL